jgi:hypothetical protein
LRIVREVHSPGEVDTVAQSGSDPLFTAWRNLTQYRSKRLREGAHCYSNRES